MTLLATMKRVKVSQPKAYGLSPLYRCAGCGIHADECPAGGACIWCGAFLVPQRDVGEEERGASKLDRVRAALHEVGAENQTFNLEYIAERIVGFLEDCEDYRIPDSSDGATMFFYPVTDPKVSAKIVRLEDVTAKLENILDDLLPDETRNAVADWDEKRIDAAWEKIAVARELALSELAPGSNNDGAWEALSNLTKEGVFGE